MIVTLKVLTDIYSKPNKDGDMKIIKRNQQYLKQFETSFITAEQYLNSKGEPSKKWCMIKNGEDYFKLNHKFEDIEKLTSHIKIEGFKLR